jgi:ethanolamine ammonia-lyase small subunit
VNAAETDRTLAGAPWPDIVRRIQARTPARLLRGRAGAAYRTDTQLELWEAHAAARDAVRAELNMRSALGAAFVEQWKLFGVGTRAGNKDEYLLRPDLGRQFDDTSREGILLQCPKGADIQVAVGDGLSVTAVATQVPALLPALYQGASGRGWNVGRAFVIRHCRVGIMNEIGELLAPTVVVLLIGERPGLATAESLSAYMAYRPDSRNTDANRNLVSNIHGRGLSASDAADRILRLADKMMMTRTSGCNLGIEGRSSTRAIP